MNKTVKTMMISMIVNTIIIVLSGFIFGWINVMYAVIAIYIMSIITDKVLLGISNNKAFNKIYEDISNSNIEIGDIA